MDIEGLKRKYRILYAEDDELLRLEMVRVLERRFGTIYHAANGEEAVSIFHEHRPDVIISDINMPKKSGIELVTQIREEGYETPVVFLTAYSDHNFFLESFKLKIDRYLLKPVDINELMESVLALMKQLHYQEMAKRYERHENTAKTSSLIHSLIHSTVNAFETPAIVKQNGAIYFINDAFWRFFSAQELRGILEGGRTFDSYLQPLAGCTTQLDKVTSDGKLVALKTSLGEFLFLCHMKTLDFAEEGIVGSLYVFKRMKEIEKEKNSTA